MPRHCNDISGFTLIEMLVVLILTVLISTLLMEGLTHILLLRTRYLTMLDRQDTKLLQERWFRNLTSSLIPGYSEEDTVFSGGPLEFHGTSLASLQENNGVPVWIDMSLKISNKRISLHYKEKDGTNWILDSWLGNSANFSYLSSNGKRYHTWPPDNGKHSQLPRAIILFVKCIKSPLIWIVDIPGRHNPKILHQNVVKSL